MADPWAVQSVEPVTDPWAVMDVKPAKRPSTIGDTVKSFATGAAEGFAPIADALVDSGPLGLLNRAANTTNMFQRQAPTLNRGVNMFSERVAQQAHEPETMAGSLARTVGQMVPNAFAPGAGIAGRAANVLAPAVASETGGQIARAAGVGEGGQAAARLIGAVAGSGAASVRSMPKAPPKPTPAKAITVDQLKAQKTAAYAAADKAGVTYAPSFVDNMISGIEQDLAKVRLNPARHPKAASMLDDIRGLAGQSPTLTELDQLRQVVSRDVASATDKAEKFMGKRIIAQIDKHLDGAQASDVVAGSATDAAALIRNARDLNTRYRKVSDVQDAVKKAEMRAGSTGSGGNADNAIRQNLRRVLEKGQNFSAEESQALEKIVMGGKGQNLLRLVGKLSPSGNGLMAAGNLASAATLGPLGAIPGAAGLLAKLQADGITRNNVQRLVQLMANGGAKHVQSAPSPQPARIAQTARNMLQTSGAAGAGAIALTASPAIARERRRQP